MIVRYNVAGHWIVNASEAFALARARGLTEILKRVSRHYPDSWYDDYVVDVPTV
jgi:hypothetical protein